MSGTGTITGTPGNDTLSSQGSGNSGDSVYGGAGDDILSGSAGLDTFDGGAGNDTITSSSGNDSIVGGDGHDLIDASSGDDTVMWSAGQGNDTIDAGSNSNTDVLVISTPGFNSTSFAALAASGPGTQADGWRYIGGDDFTSNKGGTYEYITTGERLFLSKFESAVSCFYPGTLIATTMGERAVETLGIGDLVLTSEGKAEPVRWMGRQTVSTRFGDPLRVLPVRILAGALADGVPTRDLLLSPDHAVLVEGVLVQAAALVNGTTILHQFDVPEVFTYHHIELAAHDLVVADGAPAETFVDNIDRLSFDNWAEHEALYGAQPSIPEMDRPRAKAQRQVPRFVQIALQARAGIKMTA
jgi:hypothetical protein